LPWVWLYKALKNKYLYLFLNTFSTPYPLRNFLTTILLAIMPLGFTVYSQVIPSDSLALVALYNSTVGNNWTVKTNWLVANQPVGNWFGVTRSGNRVVSVTLNNNNLTGNLPSSIGNLTALNQLSLANNKLIGTIPAEIGNILPLKILYLFGNQLTGSIPDNFINLVNVENLWLYANQLSGTVPVNIGNLAALKSLNLRDNNLSGNIPASIGQLTNLEFLYLNGNQLSGSIPVEIGNLGNLKDLYLWGNQLSGAIPSSVGNLTKLVRLYLNRNQLSGSIPVALGNITTLAQLNLQNNLLTGSIPSQLGNVISLTDLLLGNEVIESHPYQNQLTGSLPASFINLTSLTVLKIKSNKLSGNVPDALSALFNLQVIDLSDNEFTALPNLSGLPFVTLLDVRNNYLTFTHIYPNRNLINFGFFYSPQKSDQLRELNPSKPTRAPVGSAYTITIADNTPGNQYQWYRNDVLLPAFTTNVVHLSALNRNNMGVYTCTITNQNVAGLTFFFTEKVEATANITVNLFTNDNAQAPAGEVYLYEITSVPYRLELTGSVVNGTHVFSEVVLSDYIISGLVMSPDHPRAILTWVGNTIFWEDAEEIILTGNETKAITSAVSPLPPVEPGQGILSGVFYLNLPDDGRIDAKGRVKGSPVTVRRVERAGKGKDEVLELVGYTITNELGEFLFENLQVDEYKLNIQYPGYPMDEESFVRIPIGDDLFSRQVAVEAEVISNKIFVRKLIITGWQEKVSAIQAYPNPASEIIYIKGVQQQEQNEFILMDSNGKGLPVSVSWYESDQCLGINVQALKPGTYFLSIKNRNQVYTLRIVIQ
jgi:Leucine-rich repeat (LRR) protein